MPRRSGANSKVHAMTFVHHRASARNRDTPDKPRHYCRNLRCRAKLPTPVENEHHAFCCQGCHSSFYRSRCLVCEEPIRRKNERQRFGSGHKTCEQEYRRFPHVYDLPKHDPPSDARRAQEVPILRASKVAIGPTDLRSIVCAVGGGVTRSMVTFPSTTRVARRSPASCWRVMAAITCRNRSRSLAKHGRALRRPSAAPRASRWPPASCGGGLHERLPPSPCRQRL